VLNSLTPVNIVLIPGWIHKSILRNKVSINNILDYNTVRHYLSLNDMAEWFYLNDKFHIDNKSLSTSLLELVFITNTNSYEKDSVLSSTILPLSQSQEISENVLSRLTNSVDSSLSYTNTTSSSELGYKFVIIQNNILVILDEGFLSKINTPPLKFTFIQQLIKKCYTLMSITEVSVLNIFSLYLRALRS